MVKFLKKITISLGSILGLSVLFWVILLLNPSLSYAHQTQFEKITVYHTHPLPQETAGILAQAYEIIKTSSLFDPEMNIQLCLNDGPNYPNLHPLRGAVAYSFLNKTVIFRSKPHFTDNRATFSWPENKGEIRHYNLVELLAHEFAHNLQFQKSCLLPVLNDTWKIEGYADYISRKNRLAEMSLKEHVQRLNIENRKEHIGIPRFELKDGTGWALSYYRYSLLIKYLIEEKGMSYQEILDSDLSMEQVLQEIQVWAAA